MRCRLALFFGMVVAAVPAQDAEVPWLLDTSFEDALAAAKTAGKRIFIYLWENDNGDCARLYSETLKDAACVRRLGDFVCYSTEKGQPIAAGVLQRYQVRSYPTMIVVEADGTPVDVLAGFLTGKDLIAELDRIQKGDRTLADFRQRIAGAPQDLALQFAYAEKLRAVGDEKGFEEIVATIRKRDPRGTTVVGGHLLLSDLKQKALSGDKPDFGEVEAFLRRVSHREVRWDGWSWIGHQLLRRKDLDQARSPMQLAWKSCPDGEALDFAQRLVTAYWEHRNDLRTADKAFLVDVGKAQLKIAERFRDAKIPGRPEAIGDSFDRWLATRLDILACCYHVAGKRKDALATVERCLTLDPANEDYKKRHEMVEKGQ